MPEVNLNMDLAYEVLSRLWDQEQGVATADLLATFPAQDRGQVSLAVAKMKQLQMIGVDGERLVVLKDGGGA